jgi:hypothetical protein
LVWRAENFGHVVAVGVGEYNTVAEAAQVGPFHSFRDTVEQVTFVVVWRGNNDFSDAIAVHISGKHLGTGISDVLVFHGERTQVEHRKVNN